MVAVQIQGRFLQYKCYLLDSVAEEVHSDIFSVMLFFLLLSNILLCFLLQLSKKKANLPVASQLLCIFAFYCIYADKQKQWTLLPLLHICSIGK